MDIQSKIDELNRYHPAQLTGDGTGASRPAPSPLPRTQNHTAAHHEDGAATTKEVLR